MNTPRVLIIRNGRPTRESLSSLADESPSSFRKLSVGLYEAHLSAPVTQRILALAQPTNRSGVIFLVTVLHLSDTRKQFLVRYQGIPSDRDFQVTWTPDEPNMVTESSSSSSSTLPFVDPTLTFDVKERPTLP